VLAHRLSADPAVRVLLLEAGGADRNPLIHIPIGFQILRERRMCDWMYDSEPDPGLAGRSIAAYRGKVLGGSSSVNVQVFTRGDRRDYDRWAERGAAGWGYRDVLPYFKKVESWCEGASDVRGGSGPVAVQWSESPDPLFAAWARAAETAGYRVGHDMNAGDVEGFGQVQFNISGGRRASSASAYLRPALHRPNLDVLLGAHTHRVDIEGRRAVGVTFSRRGRVIAVRAAAETILCAGAFNSPQILMLSGIGPAAHLEATGIRPRQDLPVGRNLQDHWSVPNYFARRGDGWFRQRMRADRMAVAMARAYLFGTGTATRVPTNLIGFTRSRPGIEVPDIEFLLMPTAPAARLWLPGIREPYADSFGIKAAIMHGQSRGDVLLRSADPLSPPRIRFNALRAQADVDTLREGLRLARDLNHQAALDDFRGEELLPGPGVRSTPELDAFVRQHAMPVYHPAGTCAMGNGAEAVLDTALRVRGVDALRVVDAAAMPELITGHINACVMMMAERAADLIRGVASVAAAAGEPAAAVPPAVDVPPAAVPAAAVPAAAVPAASPAPAQGQANRITAGALPAARS